VQMIAPPILMLSDTGDIQGTTKSFIAGTDGIVTGFANNPTIHPLQIILVIIITPADTSLPPYHSSTKISPDITMGNVSLPARKGDQIEVQVWINGEPDPNSIEVTFLFFGFGGGSGILTPVV